MRMPVRKSPRDVYSWDPFEELKKTHEYMDQIFRAFPLMENRFSSGVSGAGGEGIPPAASIFSPLTDVVEEDDSVTITTELPGIDKKDIELNVRDNVLVISASRGAEEKQEKEGYLRKERTYTRFHREIPLPDTVTEEGASAKLLNGVLTVSLPKVKEVSGKRIQIE